MPDAYFNGAVLHQHGRPGRFSRRSIRAVRTSMGPYFISTEDERCGHQASHQRSASMGPCFISTEDFRTMRRGCPALTSFNGAVLHQHGRQSSFDSTDSSWTRFNGAVLHQHGRHFSYDAVAQQKQRRLQWGRASSARKTAPRRFSYRL